MNDQKNEKEIDELLKKVQDILSQTYSEFDILEKIGYDYQEKGVKLVEYAQIGKKHINYQLSEAPKYATIASKIPQFTSILGDMAISGEVSLSLIIDVNAELKKGFVYLDKGIHMASGSTSTASASTYAISSVTDQININVAEKDKDIYVTYNLEKPDIDEHTYLQKELDQELDLIDSNLSKRRKGAWQTFYSISADKKAQAAHTMRDILSNLISIWASNDVVKTAEWWVPVKDTKDGVSLRQRLQFLLYGPGKIADTTMLDSVEHEISIIYQSDELLKKVAHGSQKDINLVESTMKLIESIMLKIIKFRNGRK